MLFSLQHKRRRGININSIILNPRILMGAFPTKTCLTNFGKTATSDGGLLLRQNHHFHYHHHHQPHELNSCRHYHKRLEKMSESEIKYWSEKGGSSFPWEAVSLPPLDREKRKTTADTTGEEQKTSRKRILQQPFCFLLYPYLPSISSQAS